MEYPPGWACEKTELRFEYYFAGGLPLAESLAVAEHLEACPRCPQQLVLLLMAGRLRRGWIAPERDAG